MLKHRYCISHSFVGLQGEGVAITVTAVSPPTQLMFLGRFFFFLKMTINMITKFGIRDRAVWWFIIQFQSPWSWQKKKKQQLLSFMNLRRVSKWWKQTLTKEQSCSLNVSIMLLLYYIHKMFGENILAKVP